MNSFFSQHPQRPEGEKAAYFGEAVVVGNVVIHGVHPVQGSVVVDHAITVLALSDKTDENNRSAQPAEGLPTVLSIIDKTVGQNALPENNTMPECAAGKFHSTD